MIDRRLPELGSTTLLFNRAVCEAAAALGITIDVCAKRPRRLVGGNVISKVEESCTDSYFGSAAALVSLGMLKPEHLPGQPGMPKCNVFFDDLGEPILKGERSRLSRRWRGSMISVWRSGANHFEVRVRVDDETKEHRWGISCVTETVGEACFQAGQLARLNRSNSFPQHVGRAVRVVERVQPAGRFDLSRCRVRLLNSSQPFEVLESDLHVLSLQVLNGGRNVEAADVGRAA